MSVPLDRLYNYVDGLCNHDIIIYRFFPHGSKKLEHLLPIKTIDFANGDWPWFMLTPIMICHDQEPLNYDLYSPEDFEKCRGSNWTPLLQEMSSSMHFRGVVALPQNCYDLTMLCHSELNSTELARFESNRFVGVYWWSHGIIAQDWFRYAQHDTTLQFNADQIEHDFLIYNRAWQGTREYRLKFIDLVVQHNLVNNCKTTFSTTDDDIHYQQHWFTNPDLKPTRWDFETLFDNNTSDSTASADYVSADYQTCAIEVVLETLFDDTRLHLTEKSLRPIACGRPFIMCATSGSLEYLRSYGIKTFDGLIDESYDLIKDPVQRLQAIALEMKRIADLPLHEKKELWHKLNEIATYNKTLFFSDAWYNRIVSEFTENFNVAHEVMQQNATGKYWRALLEQGLIKDADLPGYRRQEDIQTLSDWLAARGVTAPSPRQD